MLMFILNERSVYNLGILFVSANQRVVVDFGPESTFSRLGLSTYLAASEFITQCKSGRVPIAGHVIHVRLFSSQWCRVFCYCRIS